MMFFPAMAAGSALCWPRDYMTAVAQVRDGKDLCWVIRFCLTELSRLLRSHICPLTDQQQQQL